MATNNELANAEKTQQDAFRIQDLFYMCLSRWYWFVISLVVCLGLAMYYVLTTPPSFTRQAAILIKETRKGRSTGDVGDFSDMGLFTSNTNINNEIATFKSPDLMLEVVKRLDLDMNYTTPGRFHRITLYGNTLPVSVDFLDAPGDESASCTMQVLPKNGVTLTDFTLNGQEVAKAGSEIKAPFNDTISTPIGKVCVRPSIAYRENDPLKIFVNKSTVQAAKNAYKSRLGVEQENERSSVILLTYSDVSIQRASDILNALIATYNENWVDDKNRLAKSTSAFISDRLEVIEGELGSVDNSISSYKSEHLLPNVEAAANMYMQQANQANADIKDLNNQIYMARFIRNYLSNSSNDTGLIPVTSGVVSVDLGQQIAEYNRMMMERNSLLANTSESNPLILDMDKNLAALRGALVSSIDNQIIALNSQIKSLQGYSGEARSQIASNPKQAKYLLSVERQQKVKESLYLYLLQKREENELSQAFTAYNTRVISTPDGSNAPTAPRKMRIMFIAFVIGMIIPIGIIYLRETLNTVVRGRKDLESLSLPFVGEIPQAYNLKKKGLLAKLTKPKIGSEKKEVIVVVKPKSRNVINEAFRVVRTNLEFMIPQHQGGVVISITSANPGSGKTFVTFNLATSLAIKGKRVIAIDLDLRKGSLSKYADSPKQGISNYLAGMTDDFRKLICHNVKDTGLDLIPIGVMPPNPTELLFSSRLEELMNTLRQEYDYIFLDCPPVEIVADAAIINQVSDQTIFLIRAGLFDRSMLVEVERFYKEHKYRNMSILLNGTDGGSGRYGYKYGYKYGYMYGYKYGYNYGYGYGYTSNKDDDTDDKK